MIHNPPMIRKLEQPAKDILQFLHQNPNIRKRIAAPKDRTVLYAGKFFRPVWQELKAIKARRPDLFTGKLLLHEVLQGIQTPGRGFPSLLAWAEHLDRVAPGTSSFVVWRALSGIYASNAEGAVSFYVGGEMDVPKIFTATEIHVLLRNPKIDEVTRDILGYYQRCLQLREAAYNFGFIAGS
jgi:hypothetical protein